MKFLGNLKDLSCHARSTDLLTFQLSLLKNAVNIGISGGYI